MPAQSQTMTRLPPNFTASPPGSGTDRVRRYPERSLAPRPLFRPVVQALAFQGIAFAPGSLVKLRKRRLGPSVTGAVFHGRRVVGLASALLSHLVEIDYFTHLLRFIFRWPPPYSGKRRVACAPWE